jgi:tRNA G18 (ribose-2'-O)-methylase SpoU
MGATLQVPFVHLETGWPDALVGLRQAGFQLVAMTPRQPSQTIDEFARCPRPARVAVIIGAEGAGLTAAAERAADVCVRIPIAASVDSLNLAVACGIVLEQVTRNAGARGILAAQKGTQT